MNPNLTQSRRDAVKERRGHGRLDRERLSTVITAKPHDSLVGLARRCRPKPQARTRRPRAPRNKSEIRRSKPRAAVFPIPRFSIIHRLATSKAEFKLVASLSFEPMEAKKPRPIWEPRNLADHVSKRSLVDVGCLESLLGLEGQLLIGNLRHLSEEVYSQPRFLYEAEVAEWSGGFRQHRAHFVDLKENPSASPLFPGRRHRNFT